MEALLTGALQYGPAGAMAIAVCWLCYHLVTQTIPQREKEHRTEMAALQSAHEEHLEEVRRNYREFMESERATFRDALAKQEKYGQILLELRDAIHDCTGAKRRDSQ